MASGAGDRLDHRALNRATLARQLLLGRVELPVTEAVGRLAGLNAQDVEPPYLTLWARLAGSSATPSPAPWRTGRWSGGRCSAAPSTW